LISVDIFLVFQRPLHWLIISLTGFTLSYGIALILFTLIIRGLLAPLYVAQIRSSKKMMVLSPKIKELQKKHGKDREALSRAMMELYKEHSHNPALGCILPLIQVPILWSLFLVLRQLAADSKKIMSWVQVHPHMPLASSLPHLSHWSLYQSDFLWLYHGLGQPDPVHILPIVAGITQWVQQRMMLNPTNDPQQRQMNQIMQFLPLMIVVFAWSYPSGLAVYWVTSNIIMMGLQYMVGGWGQLWSDPFSIPYADGATAATAPRPAPRSSTKPSQPGFMARALATKEAKAKAEITKRVQQKMPGNPAPAVEEGTGTASTKMDRYAERHAHGGSRGKPSARGAKK
jgi:YidC/Oxa1 family membrane protein insertase